MNISRKTGKWLWLIGAALCLAAPFFMLQTNSNIWQAQSLCPFKMLTGLPCPGCGINKAMLCVYLGRPLESLHYHLFGIPCILTCCCIVIVQSFELILGRQIMSRRWLGNIHIAWACAAILGSWHLMRLIFFISTHSASEILHESIWA